MSKKHFMLLLYLRTQNITASNNMVEIQSLLTKNVYLTIELLFSIERFDNGFFASRLDQIINDPMRSLIDCYEEF